MRNVTRSSVSALAALFIGSTALASIPAFAAPVGVQIAQAEPERKGGERGGEKGAGGSASGDRGGGPRMERAPRGDVAPRSERAAAASVAHRRPMRRRMWLRDRLRPQASGPSAEAWSATARLRGAMRFLTDAMTGAIPRTGVLTIAATGCGPAIVKASCFWVARALSCAAMAPIGAGACIAAIIGRHASAGTRRPIAACFAAEPL